MLSKKRNQNMAAQNGSRLHFIKSGAIATAGFFKVPSFIPPREIRNIRDLSRYRKKLTQHATSDRNRFEKILQDANFKMSNVFSDVFDLTGTKLIDALLKGNNNFDDSLELCHGQKKQE